MLGSQSDRAWRVLKGDMGMHNLRKILICLVLVLGAGSGFVFYFNDGDGFTRNPPNRTGHAGPDDLWSTLRAENIYADATSNA